MRRCARLLGHSSYVRFADGIFDRVGDSAFNYLQSSGRNVEARLRVGPKLLLDEALNIRGHVIVDCGVQRLDHGFLYALHRIVRHRCRSCVLQGLIRHRATRLTAAAQYAIFSRTSDR